MDYRNFNLFPNSIKSFKNQLKTLIDDSKIVVINENLEYKDKYMLYEVFLDGVLYEFLNLGLISISNNHKIKYNISSIIQKRREFGIDK